MHEYPYKSIDREGWMIVLHKSPEETVGYPVLPGLLWMTMDSRQPNFLELVDSQRDDMLKLAETAMASASQATDEILLQRNLNLQQMEGEIDKRLDEILGEMESQIRNQILLPNQMQMLNRLPMYLVIQRNGLFKSLAYSGFGTSLKIRDDQREQLERKADQMKEKVTRLAVDLEKELFDEMRLILDPEQRAEIEWLRPTVESEMDFNLRNKIYQLDRSNLGSCQQCDAAKTILPLPQVDKNLKSVIEKK